MKYCKKCDSTKPLSEFGKHKRRKDGLSLWCKSCKSAYDAEYRQKNKEAISKSKAEWYQNNREHCDQKTKRWVSENKGRRKEIVNQSYQNNRESKLKYSKEYRQSNPKVCADRIKNWEARNPDRVRAKNARRRVAKLNAEPSWLTQEQQDQITFLYGVAKDCELMTGDKYHVDHIVPLQGKDVCGLHVPWNLQVLPADINQAKSNKFDDKITETYC
jgi:hypothetical protein